MSAAKILIADDDFDNRMIAAEALTAAGYQTIEATNGLETLAMIEQEHPQVVLLDLSMPKLNGWDVAKRLHEERSQDRPQLIAFTAHAMVGDHEKALSAGCDYYLSKPCKPRDIISAVEVALKNRLALNRGESHG